MLEVNQTVKSLPPLRNRFSDDPALQAILDRCLAPAAKAWAEPVLTRMGEAACAAPDEWSDIANKNPPRLHQYDRFGNRVDRIEFHPAYDWLREASYGQGIIADYYDADIRRALGSHVETVKFAVGYLFSQAEQGLYCPICLTDGTAYLVERYGSAHQKEYFLPRLTSRRLEDLWEGSMFLTERAAGSDVGAIEAVARRSGGGYALYGSKWFCSNANAEVSAFLARPQGGATGTSGLGLFLLRRHEDDGTLNGAYLNRLKDKLGTRSMATGELTLDGALAEPLGDLDRGFLQMTDMLNLSRLYNAVASIASARRTLAEAIRWTRARLAFGRRLDSFPLVQSNIVSLLVEQEAAMHAVFLATELRGRLLFGETSGSQRSLLRLLIPLVKYTTAQLAVRCASECLELMGGNGYIEDFPLARFFRDAQVLPVWEGTTNILVLDTFRAIQKEQAHEAFFHFVQTHARDERVTIALRELQDTLPNLLPPARQDYPSDCKFWCDRAMQVLQATLLTEAACCERSSALAEQYLLMHFNSDSRVQPVYPQLATLKYGLLTGSD